MNISMTWARVCNDPNFVDIVTEALESPAIDPETWGLIEIRYDDITINLDVFNDYEKNQFQVYPTFLNNTIVSEKPLIVKAD